MQIGVAADLLFSALKWFYCLEFNSTSHSWDCDRRYIKRRNGVSGCEIQEC